MAFPQTRLPVVVELDLAGDGTFSTDLTAVTNSAGRRVVRADRGITITRGRQSQTAAAEPSTCRLTLDNSDGRFSPRNPTGPYYGSLRRNTPIRVSITSATAWLQVTAETGTTPAGGARVTCPDSANLSITGDIDLRFDADLDTWRGTSADLVGKWSSSATSKSYQLVLLTTGHIGLYWSTNGTAELGVNSTVTLPRQVGRMAVRATLDVDNGASGNTVTFYTSDSISGSWTQLGATVTSSGTTNIFDSTTVCTVLDTATGSQNKVIRGRVYGASILQGIGGTVRASPDFTAQTHGASSFADAQGNTWTLTGDVALTTRDVRFVGEVPSWPVAWTVDQPRNVETEIEAAGVMRRLQQGNRPLASAMRHALDARDDTVAYWPLEDSDGADYFASAVDNGQVMKWAEAEPSFAGDDQFKCSQPLPTMQGGRVTGLIRPHTATGSLQLQWLMFMPAATADVTLLVRFHTAGSRWDIHYGDSSSGSMRLGWFDANDTAISNTGFVAYGVDNRLLWCSLDLVQNGANVDYDLSILEVGDSTGTTFGGTANGLTLGKARAVRTGHTGMDAEAVFGHFIVNTSIRSLFDPYRQLNAYIGEAASARIERLAGENAATFTDWGDGSGTPMGAQRASALMDLLRECESTDAGMLFEARDRLALAWRGRRSLHTQTPTLTLDYAGRTLSSLIPTDDLDDVVNDVTVSRTDGASARRELTEGALSTQPAPDGVSPYPAEFDVSLEDDSQLADHASWRLNVGTVDEARYPQITVNLANPVISASSALTTAVRRLDVGDRLVIENPPSGWLPPDDVSQIAVGFTEYLSPKAHTVTVNCVPESPYRVGIYSGTRATVTESKYQCRGTVTAEALDTTETGVDITVPSDPVGLLGWGHNDGNYDVVILGEQMTVTAVSGTAPSQTLTVIRSVNGVVKSHSAGAAVELYKRSKWAMT